MIKRRLLFALVIAAIIPLSFVGLISNETGSRWLLQGVLGILPGQASVETVQGRLLDRITLISFNLRNETETITAKRVTLAWQSAQLFSGILKINDLIVEGLNINIVTTKLEENETNVPFKAIKLPVQVDLANLLLTNVHITGKQQNIILDKIQLSAKTESNRLKLLSLGIHTDQVNATAKGTVTLEQNLATQLSAEWAINAGTNVLWQGNTAIGGDLNKLTVENRLISPFKLTLQTRIADVLKTPRIDANGEWHDLAWPVVANPAIVQSPQGRIELTGLLNDYRVKINGKLEQRYAPQAVFAFSGKGGLSALTIEQLDLTSNTGVFQLTGDAAWDNSPNFNLRATGQKFNPAIFVSELPGSLTFGAWIKGKLNPNDLQIAAEIDQISGQLRQQPVQGQGKLGFASGRLKIESLRLGLGVNKIALEGEIEPVQGNLALTMAMPKLEILWPGLGGKLQGRGVIQGGWRHPSVTIDIQGAKLKLAEHSAQEIACTVDYRSDERVNSIASISAKSVKSGNVVIDKFVIAGNGSLKHHTFTTELHSDKSNIVAALTGGLLGSIWRGDLKQLNVIGHDADLWTLKETTPLRIEKKPLGVDIVLNEGCLERQQSSLCTQGAYFANSDFNFQLSAKAIPSSLLQNFLPGQFQITSLINGSTNLQRRNNIINGNYRLATTPAQIVMTVNKIRQEISLGASSLAGDINGDKVSADLDMKLANRDYLQANLALDTGKSQIISGKLSTSFAEFGLLQPFVPQLRDIKGSLKADLSLQGPLKKPLVNGHADLTGGSVDIGGKGDHNIGLRNIDIHALALGNRSDQIQLSGSAIPLILNQPDAAEKINLTSSINFVADLKATENLAGNFRLVFPVSTVALKTSEKNQKLTLGPASLSGVFKGETVIADLDMTLLEQDYVRGALNADLSKAQSLSAQITASIQNFAMIETFAPLLSGMKGRLQAEMVATGTLNKPAVNGNLQFSNGALTIEKLGINVSDMSLKAVTDSANSSLIRIAGSAKSGEGSIKIDGTAKLDPKAQLPVELMLAGKDFEIAKTPEAQIAVSPELAIALDSQSKKITGQVDVPKAILQIQDIPENAVQVSEDEIILGEEKYSENAAPPQNINANIEIELGKNVSFTGQGLQTNLAGKLKVLKAGEKLAMQGNVDMIKASYQRFGQDLTVRKGRFVFNGPADNPWLDVEAVRLSKNKKVTAILALTGTLRNPQTRISSEPALPESEALAYLVTGNSLSEVSKSEGNMLASAALSYGAGKVAWLTEKLGVDEFKVEEGSTLQDSLLVMGQYLTPDFYVGTKVGLFNKQANIVLKHKITDAINVETQAGTSQRIKLNYEFESD